MSFLLLVNFKMFVKKNCSIYVLRLYNLFKVIIRLLQRFTTELIKRLEYHNSGKSTYTSKPMTGNLFIQTLLKLREALIEEKD